MLFIYMYILPVWEKFFTLALHFTITAQITRKSIIYIDLCGRLYITLLIQFYQYQKYCFALGI